MPDYPIAPDFEWLNQHASVYIDGSSPAESLEIRSIGSYGVSAIRFQRGTNRNVDPPCSELVLGMDLGGSPNVRWSWGDRWREHRNRTKGHFGLSPIGVPGHFEVEGRHASLILSFPLEKFHEAFNDGAGGLRGDFGHLHERYHKDQFVFQMTKHLWELSRDASPAASFEADAATLFLLTRLSTLAGEKTETNHQPQLRFSAAQQRRIIDFIKEHLGSTIRNEDLAAQVRMSVRQFHGRCVATFGLAPHKLLMQHRVTSARELIINGYSLAEVAYACGFADQSHMNRVFATVLGISPRSLRP